MKSTGYQQSRPIQNVIRFYPTDTMRGGSEYCGQEEKIIVNHYTDAKNDV